MEQKFLINRRCIDQDKEVILRKRRRAQRRRATIDSMSFSHSSTYYIEGMGTNFKDSIRSSSASDSSGFFEESESLSPAHQCSPPLESMKSCKSSPNESSAQRKRRIAFVSLLTFICASSLLAVSNYFIYVNQRSSVENPMFSPDFPDDPQFRGLHGSVRPSQDYPDKPTSPGIDLFDDFEYPDDPSFRSIVKDLEEGLNFDYPDDPKFRKASATGDRYEKGENQEFTQYKRDDPDDPKFRKLVEPFIFSNSLDYPDDPKFRSPIKHLSNSEVPYPGENEFIKQTSDSVQSAQMIQPMQNVKELRKRREALIVKDVRNFNWKNIGLQKKNRPKKKRFRNPRKHYGFRRRKSFHGSNFHLRF